MYRVILLFLLSILFLTKSATAYQSYRGYKLFHINSGEEIAPLLEQLETDGVYFDEDSGKSRLLVDVWAEPHKQRNYAHVMVAPEFVNTFKELLDSEGFKDYRVIKRDVQRDIDRSQWRSTVRKARRQRRRIASSTEFNIEEYHNYDAIVDYLNKVTEENANLSSKFDVGATFENRRLVGIKIGSTVRKLKPAVFIDAGIHSREWIAPASALYLINKLVKGYGKEARVTGILDKFDFYIVPVANPDGYAYTFEKDRLWRKTRSRNITVNKWCVGADANRNWGGKGWGEVGANRSPCSNIYAGAVPFSEPEVVGLKNFIEKNVKDLKIYISLHSYGQLLLSPWGYTSDKPANYEDQKRAAQLAIEAIKQESGATYHSGTIAEIMYPASGTSIDYMQDYGVPYIYGIELRPEDMEDIYGFTVPKEQIEPTGRELFAGIARICDYAVEHKML